MAGSSCRAHFVHDRSIIFDRLSMTSSLSDCLQALQAAGAQENQLAGSSDCSQAWCAKCTTHGCAGLEQTNHTPKTS